MPSEKKTKDYGRDSKEYSRKEAIGKFTWRKKAFGRTAEEKNPDLREGVKVLGVKNEKPCHTRS